MKFRLISVFILFILLMPSVCFSQEIQEPKRIVVWHWMTDRKKAFEQLAQEYKLKKGVEVKFQLYAPTPEYQDKVQAAAQGDKLPDIFGVLGRKETLSAYITAGYIENLNPFMEENRAVWKRQFYPEALKINTFEQNNVYQVPEGIYGVPIDMMNIQMFYNRKLFKQAGLDPDNPPETWDEWISSINQLKKIGVTGFVSGWGEIWLINSFAYNYAYHLMGRKGLIDTIKGDKKFTDPEWIQVLSLFEQMRDEGIIDSNVIAFVNKEAERLFAIEQAAFAYNGSWSINVYKGLNPNLDYSVMGMPKIDPEKPMYIWGGAGSSFMVNAKSPAKKEAIAFLRWLTAKPQQDFLVQATQNLPSNKYAYASLTGKLKVFSENMDKIYHPQAFPVEESPAVLKVLGAGIQKILLNRATAEKIAHDVQKIKEKQGKTIEISSVEKIIPFILLGIILVVIIVVIIKKAKTKSSTVGV